MPGVGFTTWWPKQCDTKFVVKNIAGRKIVRVFGVNIPPDGYYDLMNIPVVSEADIRHALLKGDLYKKIMTKEIIVIESNIDLIQFDECQKEFLENAGITIGLSAGTDGYATTDYIFRQNVPLIGVINGSNRIFTILPTEKFLNGNFNGNEFRIIIDHNGRRLIQNIDYLISESSGLGTGYDTIRLISFTPKGKSKLISDYVIERD